MYSLMFACWLIHLLLIHLLSFYGILYYECPPVYCVGGLYMWWWSWVVWLESALIGVTGPNWLELIEYCEAECFELLRSPKSFRTPICIIANNIHCLLFVSWLVLNERDKYTRSASVFCCIGLTIYLKMSCVCWQNVGVFLWDKDKKYMLET